MATISPTQNYVKGKRLRYSVSAVLNERPTIAGSIAPSFTEGTGDTYDLSQFVTNPGGAPLTYTMEQGPLPTGVTLNSSTGLLTYDGVGAATTSAGLTFGVNDGISTIESGTFSLVVQSVSGLTLATTNFTPAVQEMVMVSPRPDTETASDEANRLWPSAKPFRYAVNILGGARPHNYELTTAPSGMTIGTAFGDTDYGIITWANPTIGTHTVTVRVRSQEFGRNTSGFLDEVTRTFELVVADRESTSDFVWLSPTGNDSNDGSFSNPVATIAKVFDRSSHLGKQCHLLPGDYSAFANAFNNNPIFLGTDGPKSIIGTFNQDCSITCESVSTSQSNEGATFGSLSSDGNTVMGFDFLYSTAFANSGPNLWTYWNQSGDRFKAFEIRSIDPPSGSVGDSNATTFYASLLASGREYFAFSHCEETGRFGGAPGASCLHQLFSCNFGVSEFNLVANAQNGAGSMQGLKDSNRDWTMAFNTLRDGARGPHTGCQLSGQNSYTTERIEICYNNIDGHGSMNYQAASSCGVHWFYRNSVRDANFNFDASIGIFMWGENTASCGPYNIFANASVHDVKTGSRVNESQSELHDAGLGIFDADNLLTGSARTNWLGQRGAEIA